MLTIRRSKHGEARYVPLNSRALETLKQLREAQIQAARARYAGTREVLSAYVFCQENGEPYRSRWAVGRWFYRVCREAGIVNFRWHDLRYSFASRLAMAGVDLYTIKELLGHKTLEMVTRYAHLSPGHQRQAVERLLLARTDTTIDTDTPHLVNFPGLTRG